MSKLQGAYGAYGYTGDLIAREAVRRGHKPILAGRDAAKTAALAGELDCPSRVFDLSAPNLGGVTWSLVRAHSPQPIITFR